MKNFVTTIGRKKELGDPADLIHSAAFLARSGSILRA
jgi:hypothetical protein